MRLLIASPAYGGQITTGYFNSMISTMEQLNKKGIEYGVMTPPQESLIPRGRNTCAAEAIKGGYTDLFFIDADLSWKWADFERVLFSDSDICGGTYAVKAFPITMNFNAFSEDLKKAEVYGKPMDQDNYEKFRKLANDKGEIKVAHVPTGFLRIKVSVFLDILKKDPKGEHVQRYTTMDPVRRERETKADFFQIGVRGADYLSEDWFFCEMANYFGHDIMLQTKAICPHLGQHNYAFGQHVYVGQTPLLED